MAEQGKAGQGRARQDKAGKGRARRGKARQGRARQGKAKQGKGHGKGPSVGLPVRPYAFEDVQTNMYT